MGIFRFSECESVSVSWCVRGFACVSMLVYECLCVSASVCVCACVNV